MTLRTKLFAVFTLTVLAATGFFAWGVTRAIRREFDGVDRERSDALVQQFQREVQQHGNEVADDMQGIADAESTLRMALDLSRPQADASLYARDAVGLAASHQLDFLEFFGDDGSLISSAQWPEQVGYKSDWITLEKDWNHQGPFLRRVELADGVELGLVAVRVVRVGDKNLYIAGGQKMGREFLGTLVAPPGTRALLYRNLEASFAPAALVSVDGPVDQAERFLPFVDSIRTQTGASESTIQWTGDSSSAERFATLPLKGKQGELLGILLIGSLQRDLMQLLDQVRAFALVIAAAGMLVGLLVSAWISARVMRPLDRIVAATRTIGAGTRAVSLDVSSSGEVGRLARAFGEMTQRLSEERGSLLQAERVASWREVARRLAHELKEPLFSLHLAAEHLKRAREDTPERFDALFFESMTAVRAELDVLRAIVARFGDFAKMPPPRLQAVNVNDIIRATLKTFEPQFSAIGRPPVTPELYLEERVGRIQADPDLLGLGLETLVLRSLDTMPAGGTLTIRTSQKRGAVRVEVSDTGAGLKPDECARAFTPFYSMRQHGLGLATVQAIASDHGGMLTVESAPGAGTIYRIELPLAPASAIPALPVLSAPALEPAVESVVFALPETEPQTEPEAAALPAMDVHDEG